MSKTTKEYAQERAEEDYIPFGEEWKKSVNQMPKKEIIEMWAKGNNRLIEDNELLNEQLDFVAKSLIRKCKEVKEKDKEIEKLKNHIHYLQEECINVNPDEFKRKEADLKEMAESGMKMLKEFDQAIADKKEMKGLLKIAKCPDIDCDNKGTTIESVPDEHGGLAQAAPCQWCEMKEKALSKQ